MRRAVCCLALASLLALLPPAAMAQGQGEFAVGYTFRHLAVDGASANLPLGVSFSAADRVGRLLSVVGELTESHRSESDGFTTASLNYLTFAGGVRFSKAERRRPRREAARPFLEFLAGGSRLSVGLTGAGSFTGSTFHLEPKGGVDLPMGRTVSLRAALGLEMEHASGGWAHTIRFDLAAVFPFGRGH